MSLTIYGSPHSRTLRVLWAAAELGLDYEHRPLEADDPVLKSPQFLKMNPAGAVPVIDDDGVILAESLAINLYLAKKHGRGGEALLYPDTLAGEAEVWRWTLWAQAHLEPWVQQDRQALQVRRLIGDIAPQALGDSLAVLDRHLAGRDWLTGEGFTIADLNVAAVLSPSRVAGVDILRHRNATAWLRRCYARPLAQSVRAKLVAQQERPG